MPVYELEEKMPYTEFIGWVEFFRKRPVGWREDQRTYMFLRTQGVKEPAEALFPTLKLIKQKEEESQVPDRAVPKGLFLEKLRKAKSEDDSGPKF